MIEEYKKIQKDMSKYIEKCLYVYFSGIYDPITEYNVTQETHRIVKDYLKKKYCGYPEDFFPSFRIRRMEDNSKMMLQIQEYYNDLRGWRYIGTITIPPSNEIHDIYIRTGFGMEEFTLMTKFGHGRNDVHIGGYIAAAEYEAQIMTPLALAYDYALSEGEI